MFENYTPLWKVDNVLRLEQLFRSIKDNTNKRIEPEYLKEYIYHTYRFSLDNHIMITGQNGMGKSLAAYWLAKYLDPNFDESKIIFPSVSFADFVNRIFQADSDIVLIDEGDEYFNYREHSTKEALIMDKLIKYLRWRKNIFMVCMKNIREVVHFYRKGKVNILIHLLNRYYDGPIASVGAVFVGSSVSDMQDKFDFSSLLESNTFKDFIERLEKDNKTFVGYIEIPRLPKEVVEKYLQKKAENEKILQEKYVEEITRMLTVRKAKYAVAKAVLNKLEESEKRKEES
ncbi:MAG: AAA family ATPase [Candidatus Jordarchaeaceae archaeon]